MKLIIYFIAALCFYQSTFYTTSASEEGIDGGQVVQIRTSKHRVRRDLRAVTFDVDGRDYHFNFKQSPREVYDYRNVPVWLVKSQPKSFTNYTYLRVLNTERVLSNGYFYTDDSNKALAFVHYDANNRDILYDGVFGENENLRLIKSLSEHEKNKYYGSQPGNHVVFEPLRSKTNPFPSVGGKKPSRYSFNVVHEELDKPLDVLYPKLLVLVDHHLFKTLNSDIATTIQYVATFWSKVDQKYTELKSVDIQLLITGIIIADDDKAFNYVYQSRADRSADHQRADIYRMYKEMRTYFNQNFAKDVNFQNYDATVMMTALDVFPVKGIAASSRICGNLYNSMIVHDIGWYSGVQTAVHELAHLLGAEHDSWDLATGCQYYDGHRGMSAMSPSEQRGSYFYWSNCTEQSLKKFATVKAAECLATRERERHYDTGNAW